MYFAKRIQKLDRLLAQENNLNYKKCFQEPRILNLDKQVLLNVE